MRRHEPGRGGFPPARVFPFLLPLLLPALFAQQNPPHLAYVYPAGGRQGTTVPVSVGGQFLVNATAAAVSGGGVRVSLSGYVRPLNPMQATELREKMQALQKEPPGPEVRKQLTEIRLKLASVVRMPNPVLAETETLDVAIDPGAAPGRRELRIETPQGLSNPLVFYVGDLPETVEKQSEIRTLIAGLDPAGLGIGAEVRVELPTVINGRIMPRPARQQPGQPFTPGEADRYRFQARKGQRLVASVTARELIPYLADAVPGWFQPTLRLLDDAGKELAYNDDYRFHPDPVLCREIPRDGDYVLEIRDSIYRGREDFVYRIAVGELPFLTGVFPLGGRAGARTAVSLSGWNLPAARATMDERGKAAGVYPVAAGRGAAGSNIVPFAVDTLPEVVEKEPNDEPRRARKVKLPLIVNGRIDRPGDRDVYAIDGRAGDEIVAEVQARRLDSPLDSTLKLTDSKGKQLAFNDDHEDKGSGLLTHHADSYLTCRLPAKGRYYVTISDAARKGGPEYAYRLRLSAPRPDFELRVTPSAINAGRGMNVPLVVYALRRDGFGGEIALTLKDGPRGVALAGGLIPAGQDDVRLTLAVPPAMALPAAPLTLAIEGKATIRGKEEVRRALPVDDMMQAFAYHHLVPADSLKLAVTRRGAFRSPARIAAQVVKIPAGGSVRVPVQVQLPPNGAIRAIHFELSDPPDGVKLRAPTAEGGAIVIDCDAARVKPGLKGNLIVNILGERQAPATAPAAARANLQRVPLGALPATAFEIVAPPR